jgi:hypothetical protein
VVPYATGLHGRTRVSSPRQLPTNHDHDGGPCARSTKVSRPRESHPKPLAEPYVTLSCHTAPIVRTETLPKMSQWTNNRGCFPLMLCNQHSDCRHFPANLRYLRRAQRMRV